MFSPKETFVYYPESRAVDSQLEACRMPALSVVFACAQIALLLISIETIDHQ